MITVKQNFDGQRFANKYGLSENDFYLLKNGKLFCPSLPDLTEADIADCIVAQHHNITTAISLVAVGVDVPLKITGAPNSTVEIDTGITVADVVLDENGNGSDIFTPPVAGNYYLKFVDQSLSTLRVKIEAVE